MPYQINSLIQEEIGITVGIIRNRQAALECCQNEINRSINRLENCALSVLHNCWKSEFKNLPVQFLSCCMGGSHTAQWCGPNFFVYTIGEDQAVHRHKKYPAIKKFCKRMSKELGIYVAPSMKDYKTHDV